MDLTRKQKKYLKKNLKRFPLSEIGTKINLTEKQIREFLKSRWGKDKYNQFLKQQKNQTKEENNLLKKEFKFNIRPWFSKNWLRLTFLALLVTIVYFNSLTNDFVSDDISGIKENANLSNFSSLFNNPLTFLRNLFYFLVFKIWGLEPLFFRLINIFFHLGSVWLIYLLISLLLNPTLALLTASIFAVHPVLSESVIWISGGPYSQYTFFLLAGFLFYIISKGRGWLSKSYYASILAFLLALLTTEKAIIFPFILLSFEICFDRISKTWRKLTPFFLLSATWSLVFFLQGSLAGRMSTLQTEYYQKPGLENPLIQIPVALSSYLELIVWPKNLTLYHSEMVFSQAEYFLRVGVILLFFAGLIFFFKKDKRIFFWLAFSLISLLPTLTPFKISWIVAERYIYLGALGGIVLIAIAIQKIGEISKNAKISYLIFGFILILLATRTIIRNTDWKNQDTLWLATAKTSPSSPQNHNNLGDYYIRQGDLQKAVEEFQKAIQLKPNYGDAFHNLANTYQQMGKTEQAIENYQKALSFNLNLWQSYQNLAAIYFEQEKFILAEENFRKAIAINPQNSSLHTNLGIIYLKMDNDQKAKEALQTAVTLDPTNQKAKQLLMSITD